MNSLQIIYSNALCTHLCSSLSSRLLYSDILICIQNMGKKPKTTKKQLIIIMGRRARNKKEDKSFRYVVGILVFISPLDSEKLNPKVTELHLSSKIAMRATRSGALMGAPEFFCYQEILAVMFAQSKNFLPLFLTLFIFLHKKRELTKNISGKK